MATDKIVTPIFRASFLNLLEPKVQVKPLKGGGTKETRVYECTMIFEPTDDLSALKRIVEQAIVEKFGNNRPHYIKTPFREGRWKTAEYQLGYDLNKYPEYEGKIIASARSYEIQPGVVDSNLQPILDKRELYSGIWGRASLVAFYYNNQEGGQGISFGLQNFQKIRDDEPLGTSRGKAEDDFEAFTPPAGMNEDLLGV